MYRLLLALLLAITLLPQPAFAVEPDSIDPLADGALTVLAADPVEYGKAAEEAYNAGEYLKAAQNYLAALSIDNSNTELVYNLACCYSLLGAQDEALACIEACVNSGMTELWQFNEDPDFAALQDAPEFTALLERLEAETAEQAAALGGMVYFKAPVYLRGRIHFPEDYDPAKPCKLIVGLHGYGHHPEGFSKLAERFNKDGNQFIYVALQAPYAWNPGGGEPGYSWGWGTEQYGLPAGSWGLSEDYVASAVEQLRNSYNVSETYLLGFSQGAMLTLSAGIRHHKLFDGLMVFGGNINGTELTTAELEAGKHLRVFIGHGDADNVVPTAEGQAAYDALVAAGYDATYFTFAGAHRVPEELTDAALAWINTGSQEETAKE